MSQISVQTYEDNCNNFKIVSKTLAIAFQDDYNYIRFIPDDDERARRLLPTKEIIINLGKRYGFIDVTSDLNGVSVWFDSDTGKRTNLRMIRSGLINKLPKIGLKFTNIMLKYYDSLSHTLEKKYASFHHVYLSFIGVRPEFQSRGYGAKLLQPMLKYADEHKLPCYLEAPKFKLIEYYSKFGFQLKESASVAKPYDDCFLHVMVRDAI